MKKWFIALAAAVFISGCSTLEIQVDYDNEHDFSALSTFAVVYTNQNDGRDFSRDRISRLLSAYMKNKGYENVDKSAADFYVIMHLDVQKKSQVETNYETIGIRPVPYMYLGAIRPIGTYPGTYVSGAMVMEPDVRVTTTTNEYEEGRLILEVFNVKENRVVWQGIARDELSKEYTQQEKSDYINRVISELFKDFPIKK
ncbi:DUF4136 domain-containing protein [Sulfurimonas sp.]|jgi:hypothetical protein|uniref:DUF4136 domain-containing protein n=1 Tax=Sulfurimonas sp. TaxID=2022749 RepID=UPI002A36EE6D|nr:DUF4136 domain-containing protein [Sulfurimonas sp.]MDY0124289.1 DUF4136 domain-containing protein [Sulfurimonas sp.]